MSGPLRTMPHVDGLDLLRLGATAPSHVYPSLAGVRELEYIRDAAEHSEEVCAQ